MFYTLILSVSFSIVIIHQLQQKKLFLLKCPIERNVLLTNFTVTKFSYAIMCYECVQRAPTFVTYKNMQNAFALLVNSIPKSKFLLFICTKLYLKDYTITNTSTTIEKKKKFNDSKHFNCVQTTSIT